MKNLLLVRKVTYSGRRRSVSLHPMQLKEVGIEVGDEVNVYVKGNKIIIESRG